MRAARLQEFEELSVALAERTIAVLGGGLAGCEAAWQAAERGRNVRIVEMRPHSTTPAHHTDLLAELVCSNSFRAEGPLSAAGALKNELRKLGSLVMRAADETRVPSGRSLAVERTAFSTYITREIAAHRRIEVERREATDVPDGMTIVATGPLTSAPLVESLKRITGAECFSFFDAIAPIIDADSLEPGTFFEASRYEEKGDYLNIPLIRDEYERLIDELVAVQARIRMEEDRSYFEGCLPIEEMARRGRETLRFGPMKPVGLVDPTTGARPYAALQLRREALSGKLYNMVGFQTQLSIADQERIFRAIPALKNVVFIRHGSAHRNTFIDSPKLLDEKLSLISRPELKIAGQLAGVEGYIESAAAGAAAGIFAAIPGTAPLPRETVIGGLLRYISHDSGAPFQPMKANWGVVPEPAPGIRKCDRKEHCAARAAAAMDAWLKEEIARNEQAAFVR